MTDADTATGSISALGLSLEVETAGIGRIRLRPRRGTSLPLSLGLLHRLEDVLEEVESRVAAGNLDLVIIETAAPHPSLTGYDLEEIRSARDTDVLDWSFEAQRILRRLELLEIPSIAAMRSDWFGGAAEVALSCSYRVGSDAPESRISFPQSQQGFLPAWGGTARLPRLVGLQAALRLILTGSVVSADEAVEIGLLDEVLPDGDFDRALEEFARGRLTAKRSRRRRRRPVRRRIFDDTAPGRRLLAARASRLYVEEASSNVAAGIALDLITETSALPLEDAFARESIAAGELIVTTEAQGRLHSERFTERAARRSPMGRAEFESAAVLGGGETGSDLAHLIVSAGTPVRIRDKRRAALEGVARARARIAWERRHGRISDQQAQRRNDRITPATGFGGFGLLDLVIAAADGSEQAPLDLLLQVEPHVRDECLLAFHDWSLSPTAMQRELKRPERLVGIAAALPPDRFRLLEIIPGTLTAPETVSAARRLARRLSLTGVLVSDHTPTPGSRLIGIYLAEAARLLDDGAGVEQVDDAAAEFGFDLGPFHRIDAIGSRRVHRMLESLGDSVGDRMRPTPLLTRIADEDGTFYRYRGGRPIGRNPDLASSISMGSDDVALTIRRRLLLSLINEGVRIVEEGCVTDPGDLEVISIFGLGFPRERGGLLFYAQEVGLGALVDDLGSAVLTLGERFAPAGLLRDLASTGRGFFGADPQPPSGHEAGPALQS